MHKPFAAAHALALRAVATLCVSWIALPAAAVMVRADRDDAEYLELATRYTAALSLGAGAGEAVLVAPRWVLTLARNAAALEKRAQAAVEVHGRRYGIASVHLPKEWGPGAADDVALVFLREAVADVEPVPIYREGDERGKGIVFVGHGASGPIGSTARARDGKARGGINTIDEVAPRTFDARLKALDDASDLQGALAPDETGAPAFVEVAGRLFVAGIAEPPGAAGAAGQGVERFVRVSARADWIDATMFRVAAQEAATATQRR